MQGPIYDTFKTVINRKSHTWFKGNWYVHMPDGISDQTRINLPPRIRMTMLYAISQTVNGRVACTDNLSESYIGYSTRWGDNIGDFCPLANLTSEDSSLLCGSLFQNYAETSACYCLEQEDGCVLSGH